MNESSLICVWWVQEPSRPQHLLSSRSVPTSATFSPGRPSLVLAGLEDGSLAAWDLREPVTLHTQFIEIDGVMWKVRVPSFVTGSHCLHLLMLDYGPVLCFKWIYFIRYFVVVYWLFSAPL